MKTIKTLCLVSALIVASPAFAEWVEAYQDKQTTGYIDSNLKRNGDKVTFWELVDYKIPQSVQDTNYRSMKTKNEFDCANEMSKITYVLAYSEKMGGGEPVLSQQAKTNWKPVAPQTLGAHKMDFVCNFTKTNLK